MSDISAYLQNLDLYRGLGLLGFGCYVLNYCCLSFRILNSESLLFFVINTTAAALVLTSLTVDFNLAAMMIQLFWIVIGSCAIALRLRERLRLSRARRDARAARPPALHDSHAALPPARLDSRAALPPARHDSRAAHTFERGAPTGTAPEIAA